MWPKNTWKRIPYLIQQHEAPRKGRSTIKAVRAQKFPRTDISKLSLQVENDKIRLKT